MKTCSFVIVFIVLCAALVSHGQYHVSPRNLYQRVYAVVPMVGDGTYENPRRPMFTANRAAARSRGSAEAGTISYSYQVSDNGRLALVEFVARDKEALRQILSSGRGDVKVFHKGTASRPQIEQEFQKHRKAFDWSKFGALAR